MKVNFKEVETQTSFDGDKKVFDIARELGNQMMYNGSILLDIGFEELAKEIYYSQGEIEIPDRYIQPIIQVMKQSNFIASVKREVIRLLSQIGE